jgi:hypothetical protein
VEVEISDSAVTKWKPAGPGSKTRLFRRKPTAEHQAAMTQALNALLCEMPL